VRWLLPTVVNMKNRQNMRVNWLGNQACKLVHAGGLLGEPSAILRASNFAHAAGKVKPKSVLPDTLCTSTTSTTIVPCTHP
jgi:hypothetical protein